jgi:hypothetical protein
MSAVVAGSGELSLSGVFAGSAKIFIAHNEIRFNPNELSGFKAPLSRRHPKAGF